MATVVVQLSALFETTGGEGVGEIVATMTLIVLQSVKIQK